MLRILCHLGAVEVMDHLAHKKHPRLFTEEGAYLNDNTVCDIDPRLHMSNPGTYVNDTDMDDSDYYVEELEEDPDDPWDMDEEEHVIQLQTEQINFFGELWTPTSRIKPPKFASILNELRDQYYRKSDQCLNPKHPQQKSHITRG